MVAIGEESQPVENFAEIEHVHFPSCVERMHLFRILAVHVCSKDQEDRSVFAPDLVGDGDDGVSGPFQNAYNAFCKGGVIPLVVGAHTRGGEKPTKKTFNKVSSRFVLAWR